MRIFDRFADMIKSYLLEDEDEYKARSEKKAGRRRFDDPDLAAAHDDIDAFLKGDNREKSFSNSNSHSHSGANEKHAAAPLSLARDFAELGLPTGASAEECKAAYKSLLKIHHPDRHAGHDGNTRKATEKSARINAAFDRIERWRKTGKAD